MDNFNMSKAIIPNRAGVVADKLANALALAIEEWSPKEQQIAIAAVGYYVKRLQKKKGLKPDEWKPLSAEHVEDSDGNVLY